MIVVGKGDRFGGCWRMASVRDNFDDAGEEREGDGTLMGSSVGKDLGFVFKGSRVRVLLGSLEVAWP